MAKKKKYQPKDFDQSTQRARANRKRLSKPEIYCDAILKMLGLNYIFQFVVRIPYDYYIVDFYIPDASLVIEIDGPEHDNKRLEDTVRENEIRQKLKVDFVRFTNKFVLSHPLDVLIAIKDRLSLTDERLENMISDLMTKIH